jgi:hypothetical protein
MLVAGHAATAVMVKDAEGEPTAVKVQIVVEGEPLGSRLPVEWKVVLGVIRQDCLARPSSCAMTRRTSAAGSQARS